MGTMETPQASLVREFEQTGFLVRRQLAPPELVARLARIAQDLIERPLPPVEYEAHVGYPGAPAALDLPGGGTIRRVCAVIGRDPAFAEWAGHPRVLDILRALLGPRVVLPLAHHNCIMAKDPQFSSDTGWHRDIRYWRYQREELVSVQLALNSLTPDSGSLFLLSGSHQVAVAPGGLDEAGFLRRDYPANRPLFDHRVETSLEPGDVIFFHCRLFHAARRNRSREPRRSLIFTYRAADNPPIPGTRSASMPELPL